MFFHNKFSKPLEFYYLEPGFYPSITDIVETMNTLIQERHNHSENSLTVKVSRRTQKVQIYLVKKGSGLAFCTTDLGQIFWSNVGKEFGVMLRGKGPQKPEFTHDIVRIHSFMIYTDLIEYNFVVDLKAPLLRCFHFISKLKSGDILTTGQYMNYQTFSNLQFRPLLRNIFHRIHLFLRDTSGEKIAFISKSLRRKFLKLLQFLLENLQHTQWMMNRTRLSVVIFVKNNYQNHVTEKLFTIALAANASAQLFPDNTLRSFTDFSPEQLNLEGQ